MMQTITEDTDVLTHEQALALITPVGITVHSTNKCSDRNHHRCTSLDGVRKSTIAGLLYFKSRCGCPVVITGGTEVGHAPGEYSHGTGYKLDLRMSAEVTEFIVNTFKFVGIREFDQARQYDDGKGNIYAQEVYPNGVNNHWDVTYFVGA